MFIRFCTKRDINGNRKILIIDENNKSYNDQNNRMVFVKSDFVVISASDLKKIKDQVQTKYVYDPALY